MLDNGKMLVFNNGTYRGYSVVREIDPLKEKIVWEYMDKKNFYSLCRSGVQRLSKGTSQIIRVHLVSNKGELHAWQIDGRLQEARLSFQDNTGIDQSIFYYVRVIQMDEEMAWSSPTWVTYRSKD